MAGNAPTNAELAEQIAALTAVVANLANAIAGNQAPPAAAAPPVTTVAFATSPGVAAVEELIDYTTKHGANLYEQGTKALGTPFSMKASQVVIFEKELQDRASMMGWDKGAQNILKFTNKDGRQISLIANTAKSMRNIESSMPDIHHRHQFRQASSTKQRANVALSVQQPH
eukprot:CCRYP_010230-RA/>CCRYP_010230-RA protein AED:0.47 eAED:0.47 QI:0/-1/0/1/-1/1/1/0/170